MGRAGIIDRHPCLADPSAIRRSNPREHAEERPRGKEEVMLIRLSTCRSPHFNRIREIRQGRPAFRDQDR
jgi:hypothetical protein